MDIQNPIKYPAGPASLFAGHAREEQTRPILRYCRNCRGLTFHAFKWAGVNGRVYECSCGHQERVR